MSLSVDKEGIVVVRVPMRLSKREIERFILQNNAWIERQREKQKRYRETYPEPGETEVERLKAAAKAYIPQRVEYYADKMRLYPLSVKITSAQKRFGSCSAKNGLCFSWRLMRYPMAAVDYVIVHELAHIAEKNHGKRFYAVVERLLPDYKLRIRMLKGE